MGVQGASLASPEKEAVADDAVASAAPGSPPALLAGLSLAPNTAPYQPVVVLGFAPALASLAGRPASPPLPLLRSELGRSLSREALSREALQQPSLPACLPGVPAPHGVPAPPRRRASAGASLLALTPSPLSPHYRVSVPRQPPSPVTRSLASSFEHALLAGRGGSLRRASPCAAVAGFTATLVVRAASESGGVCVKRRLPFSAEWGGPGAGQPYCASVALDGGGGEGGEGERIRVPSTGEVSLELSNPEGTLLHTFRLAYDLAHPLAQRPAATRAYLRQRVLATPRGSPAPPTLRYALQLRFTAAAASTARRKVYLQGALRVVFPQRRPDSDLERLHVVQDELLWADCA